VRQMVIDSRAAESLEIGPQIERLLREASQPASALAEVSPASDRARAVAAPSVPAARKRAPAGSYRHPSEVPAEEVLAALRDSHWEVKAAATRLGISRPSLYVLMDKIPGLRKAVDLTRSEILAARERHGGDLDAAADRLEVSRKGLQQRMKQLGIS